MSIDLSREDGKVKIIIDGNIDTEGGQKLTEAIHEVERMDGVKQVVLDMSTVKTSTSSGIGKLLNFYKYLDSKGAFLEINGISDSLNKQFSEIHLDRIFKISKA